MTDLETMLRSKLLAAVEASPEPTSVAAVADRVRTRRRRLTAVAALGGMMAVAIPALIVATSNGGVRDTQDAPVVRPDDLGIPSPAEVGSLPLGEPPNTPWSHGRTLHIDDREIPVPGTGGPDVIGVVDGGWFLLVEREQFHPYVFSSEYGILHPDGSFTSLPNLETARLPNVQEAAVSPAGDQVAGAAVVDVETGSLVASLPDHARNIVGWGPSGIVYNENVGTDGPADSLLWTPGSDPIPLAHDVADVVSGSSHVIAGEPGRCGEVADLRSDGSLTTLWRGCGGLSPGLLSPDGTMVLTSNLSVIDVESGGLSGRLSIDATGAATALDRVQPWRMIWEDAGHLLLVVDGRWLVRCAVPAMGCERAAGPLHITTDRDINFVGQN